MKNCSRRVFLEFLAGCLAGTIKEQAGLSETDHDNLTQYNE